MASIPAGSDASSKSGESDSSTSDTDESEDDKPAVAQARACAYISWVGVHPHPSSAQPCSHLPQPRSRPPTYGMPQAVDVVSEHLWHLGGIGRELVEAEREQARGERKRRTIFDKLSRKCYGGVPAGSDSSDGESTDSESVGQGTNAKSDCICRG